MHHTATGVESMIILRDDWAESVLCAGEIVHIFGAKQQGSCHIIDNDHGYLIIKPDCLISCTSIAESFLCLRRTVLKDRVRAANEVTKPLVYGQMLHEVFQQAILEKNFSIRHLELIVEQLVITYMEQLFWLSETPESARSYLLEKLLALKNWADLFLHQHPQPAAYVADHRQETSGKSPRMSISKLLDIEEHIWSPLFGLKGKIDATVEVKVTMDDQTKTLAMPLELKSGLRSDAPMHRAQTMLYTLLLTDRYDVNVEYGLLYYMEKQEMIRVRAIRNELRSLMIKRNDLALTEANLISLPPMIDNEKTCKKCYVASNCLLYKKAHDYRNSTEVGTRPPSPWFREQTGHLTVVDLEFLNKWDTMLSQEERQMSRYRHELWTLTSEERQKSGRCFGDLTIVATDEEGESNEAGRIMRYRYRLGRNHNPSSQLPLPDSTSPTSYLDGQMQVGEPICVSDEEGHYALAMGYILQLRPSYISVAVDRRLHGTRQRKPDFNLSQNQKFNGVVDLSQTSITSSDNRVRYRVDKDEFKSGMSLSRNNLVQLFVANGDAKRRALVVELARPKFSSPASLHSSATIDASNLNVDQRAAVEKVMSAEDYALILGMPGTGKTSTIAHIIRTLVKNKKSVLLTSYTHSAVDNTLLKLRNDNFRILRLGSPAKVHPHVQEFAVVGKAVAGNFDELYDYYHGPPIVATTCLGINHLLFTKRQFDYCLVDEASQLTLPACLGPIRLAKRFVLVGDHYQLPPLVIDNIAKRGGMEVSLFKLLCESHPQAIASLEHQYRMNEDILTVSNKLVYHGRLKCGTTEVAKQRLMINSETNTDDCLCPTGRCWMAHVLNPTTSACFLNTDLVPARESEVDRGSSNLSEALLVKQMVNEFLNRGVQPYQIGVMSIYRSQVKLLTHHLRQFPGIEVHTADKFQGRDKDCVIISLVRSNPEQRVRFLI